MKKRLAGLILVTLLAVGCGGAGRADEEKQSLDAARTWLAAHPPDGINAPQRRQRMAIIQNAADRLTPRQYHRYAAACTTRPAVADRMEKSGILYYLKTATDRAIADIHRTKVRKGLAVWHIYNVGYVFKTPDTCFGIDLCLRDGQRLVHDLDFLLVSHGHSDHVSPELMDAMIKAGKPVVTSFRAGSRRLNMKRATTRPVEMRFGSARVRIDIGDHHHNDPKQRDNMLMFQVDCPSAGRTFTIYHSGDGSNLDKISPDRPVDVLIFHVSVGLPVERTIRKVDARMALVSHVLELGHSPTPPQAWRWSYDFAFNAFKTIPEERATVLTWGERWLAPGSKVGE